MVLTSLLGSVLGFGTSLAPAVMEFLQDGKDKKHELKLAETQLKLMDKQKQLNLAEAKVTAEMEVMLQELKNEGSSIREAHKPLQLTGITWVDALRSSVRPVVTYWFMGLYSYAKFTLYIESQPVWDEMDQALFATIISFWFGDRIRKYYQANKGRR